MRSVKPPTLPQTLRRLAPTTMEPFSPRETSYEAEAPTLPARPSVSKRDWPLAKVVQWLLKLKEP